MQLANSTNDYSGIPLSTSAVSSRERVPLLAKVYLRLGTWKRALSPGLDDESIRGNEVIIQCNCTVLYCCL